MTDAELAEMQHHLHVVSQVPHRIVPVEMLKPDAKQPVQLLFQCVAIQVKLEATSGYSLSCG